MTISDPAVSQGMSILYPYKKITFLTHKKDESYLYFYFIVDLCTQICTTKKEVYIWYLSSPQT